MAKKNKKNKKNNYAPTKDANGKKLSRKERKAQRKALLKSQKELEAQLVADGKIPRRNKYRSKNFFGRMLALVLMFFFGIFATVGAFFGFGAFAPMKDVFWLVGLDSTKFLTDEYSAKGILDLVGGILTDIQDHNIDSLGAISKYTPILDTYVDDIVESLSTLGVRVDKDTLKATPLSELGAYFQDEVMGSIVLGETLGVKPGGDAMLIGLCYGEEGIDFTVENDEFVQVTGGRAPTTLGDLMDSPTDIISQMRLGTLMGLNKNVTESALKDNAMMYALCYGKRGEDYEVRNGNIVVLSNNAGGAATLAETDPSDYVHTFPTTLDGLMNHSNAVIESLELGDMLGLDGSDADTNGVMYSLAYGSRGTDWEYENGEIVMLDGHDPKYPTKMGKFINNSDSLIDGMEVETLMNIDHNSNSMMHYLAYGTEMAKGKEPYTQDPVTQQYHDAEEHLVDEHGYLLDTETNFYPIEEVTTSTDGDDGTAQTTTRKQYKDDARFVYVYESGEVTDIKMLPNPNAEGFDPADPWATKPYEKKKISDLTDGDADLVEGMKIGDAMEIDSSSSALMQAMKDWTIGDLEDKDKIESLTIGDVIAIDDDSSNIMQALKNKTLAEMKDQNTIDALKLSDVLEITDESSGIMRAMQDWHLDDLNSQYRIDRLKISNVIEMGDDASSLMQAMKDWRIGDLNKQEKIDSLTLGDVIDIDETEGILASLKDCPIGSMQPRIDSLTLAEIIGKEVNDNKLLKHLKDSTVDTLSSDMDALSIGEVFADEIFSFMEIKEGKTYQKIYEAYYTAHSNEDSKGNSSYLPQKYSPNGKAIVASEVETYYVLTSSLSSSAKEVVLGYYTKSGEQYTIVPAETVVKKDAAIAMANREGEPQTQKTPYYFETEIELTPVYTYSVVNYDKSKLDELPADDEVIDSDGTLYYKTGETQYEIKEDGYGLYYLIPAAVEGEEDTRVDLDREISGYKIEGGEEMPLTDGKIEYNGTQYEVRHMKAVETGGETKPAYDYIMERTEVYERFAEKDGAGTTTYPREDTTEQYRYTPEGSGAVQLDRYLEGVWFMLLAHESGAEGAGTITYDVSKPILEMDGLITEINSSITTIPLWKLYFHGMLQEDPFVKIPESFGTDGVDLGNGKKVKNLNECTVTETITLVNKLLNPSE